MHWILEILRHLRQAFRARVASSFFCSQAESTPAHCPRTETVGPLVQTELIGKLKNREFVINKGFYVKKVP